jgi:hypothetical protein
VSGGLQVHARRARREEETVAAELVPVPA